MGSYDYTMMDQWGGNGVHNVLGMIFFFFFILAVGYVVLRMSRNADSGKRSFTSAIDILKERYAKGEIKKDEFEEMRKDLER